MYLFLDYHVSKNRAKLAPNPSDSHRLRCRTRSKLIAILNNGIAAQFRMNLYSAFLMPPPRSLVQRLNKVIASLGKSLSAIYNVKVLD